MALLSSCGRKPLYGMASQIRPQTIQKLSFYRISCVPFKLLEQWLLALAPELIVDLQLPDQQAAFIVDKMLYTSWL